MRRIVWEIDKSNTIVLEVKLFGYNRLYHNSRLIKEQFSLMKSVEFTLDEGKKVCFKTKQDYLRVDFELHVNDELQVSNCKSMFTECPSCSVKVSANDRFCESCGAELPKAERHIQNSNVKEARKIILILAVLFAIFGGVMFAMQSGQADQALSNIQQFQDSDIFPQEVNGQKLTVGELRSQILFEKWSILGLNVFLAALMLGLSFWARKAPLAALLVAASIYIGIQVLNALLDPTTIAQGFIMKIFIIGYLVKGIKSSLQMRAAKVDIVG